MNARIAAWCAWAAGVLLFPIGGVLANDRGPLPIYVLIFSGKHGLVAWVVWGIAFALMTWALTKLDGVSRKAALAAQVLGGLVMLTTPILPSHDPFAYFLYGDMALHHQDAWHPPLLSVAQDQVVSVGILPWHNPPVPCVYGPVFVAIEAAIVGLVSAHNVISLVVAQRVVSLAAAVAVTLMLRTRPQASWALHPLVLFEAAIGAHNDLLMLFFVAASLRMRASWFAGPLLACAGMVKVIALGAAAFRPRIILATAITVAAFVAFNHSALGIGQLTQHQELNPVNSPIMIVRAAIRYGLHQPKLSVPASKVLIGALALAALAALAFTPSARRGMHPAFGVIRAIPIVGSLVSRMLAALAATPFARLRLRRDRAAIATLVLIAAIPIIYPWYFTWAVLAAAIAHRTTRISVGILCSVSYLLYLQSFVSFAAKIEYPVTIGLWGCVAVVVTLLLRSRHASYARPPG